MACRIIYDNLITAESMFTVSSLKNGLVSDAQKDGTGSAVLTPGGTFSGAVDLEYVIECDGVGAGAEVGQATFKWTSSFTDGWNATGVTTSLTDISLNNGVTIRHASGTGDDFALGDRWYFKALNLFSAGKMIDLDRDTRYRSAALESPNTIVINLGSEKAVKALVIYDHNFTDATIAIQAHTEDAWGDPGPDFSEVVAHNAEKNIYYLSATTTKQYWRLTVLDAGNSDGYIEIGELILASYFEVSKMYTWRPGRGNRAIVRSNVGPYGVRSRRFYNRAIDLNYSFRNLADADIAGFDTVLETITNKSTGKIDPVIWTPDTGDSNTSYLVEYDGIKSVEKFTSLHDADLALIEVLKSI